MGLLRRHRARRIAGRLQRRRLAVVRVGLAEDVVLERQDAVVVRGAAEEHRPGRHQRPLGPFDQLDVAGAAGLPRDAVVRRIDEADVGGAFLVQQRVTLLRIGRAREMPGFRIARQNMAAVADVGVLLGLRVQAGGRNGPGVAAMAADAAQLHRL